MIIVTILALILLFVLTSRKIGAVYQDNTLNSIYTQKKIFIMDTVNNQINRIETKRVEEAAKFQVLGEEIFYQLKSHAELAPESFPESYKSQFEQIYIKENWTAILWLDGTNEVIYDPRMLIVNDDVDEFLQMAENTFPVSFIAPYGNYEAFFGVDQQTIDNLVKESTAQEIHNSYFADDTYIWVNEVINYVGGDGYAIRKIHPNLPETEGMLLSTNMTDIMGNFPYLEELEGVKQNGEVFFTYFFKKLDSDKISEKLTYAKLYKEFDWIIAMGIHLDDMQTYIDKANIESKKAVSNIILTFIALLILFNLLSYAILFFIEKLHHKHTHKELQDQANFDFLTNAYARRVCERDLKRLFSDFQSGQKTPVVLLCDLDDFKLINDTFGHDEGDRMLITLVDSMKSGIRASDKIYRWGGDEFVIICEYLQYEHILEFCEKLIETVKYSFPSTAEQNAKITISIGASCFTPKDHDHTEVIKRADTALYQSKSEGKNRATILQ
jgi:diguanylate cyclase (GGDEF)-like protein